MLPSITNIVTEEAAFSSAGNDEMSYSSRAEYRKTSSRTTSLGVSSTGRPEVPRKPWSVVGIPYLWNSRPATIGISQKIDKETTKERIHEQIADRITEEKLREHVKSVLMVTANGQIVAEYAREHADVLDSDVFKKLIQLLDDIIRPLSPNDPPERDSRGVGWWRRLRAYFTRRHSSRRAQGEHK